MASPERILADDPNDTYDLDREAVCEAAPTEEVARRYTDLERFGGGGWYMGNCPHPNHDDEGQSFYVSPAGSWECYSCGHSGDVVDLEFLCGNYGSPQEAIMALAIEYGVGPLPERNGVPEGNTTFVSFVSFVPEAPPWPVLADEAFYGLAGDIARSIEPHTEADPVAVLVNQLAAFGSAAGRGAFLRVGADHHYLKLNIALVGETSKGRKGQSWGHVRDIMHAADGDWAEERVLHGLSSGEGLIYAVRDRMERENKDGERVVIDPGVDDKRLLVLEAELAGVLKVMSREGNTLSPVIRQAWDDGRLQVMTRNNPMKATGAHVSVVGHITKAERWFAR
jgi:hypothetical protein